MNSIFGFALFSASAFLGLAMFSATFVLPSLRSYIFHKTIIFILGFGGVTQCVKIVLGLVCNKVLLCESEYFVRFSITDMRVVLCKTIIIMPILCYCRTFQSHPTLGIWADFICCLMYETGVCAFL